MTALVVLPGSFWTRTAEHAWLPRATAAVVAGELACDRVVTGGEQGLDSGGEERRARRYPWPASGGKVPWEVMGQ